MKFSNSDFVAAVQNTRPERGQLEKIAALVGCTTATASRRLKQIAARGDLGIEVSLERTFDKQPDNYGQGLFGGAAVCVRRFLVARMKDDEARDR